MFQECLHYTQEALTGCPDEWRAAIFIRGVNFRFILQKNFGYTRETSTGCPMKTGHVMLQNKMSLFPYHCHGPFTRLQPDWVPQTQYR